VIGERFVTCPDVVIQPQGLANAAEIVELPLFARLLDALLHEVTHGASACLLHLPGVLGGA